MSTPTNVFYTLVVFAFMWKVSLAFPPYSDVEIVDGKCKWENHLVPDGEFLNLEDPCQTWQCSVEDRSFAILGCGLIGNPYNCEIVRGTGPYPNCCYRTNCTGIPQYPRPYYLGNDYRYPGN
uniref:Single domain-containing protein n=1 Tax=Ixodes ricinus TaxID=34613 RepID=V5ICZ5_IXORI